MVRKDEEKIGDGARLGPLRTYMYSDSGVLLEICEFE